MKTGTIGQRRALLSLILLGGFLLRLYQLGAQSLWYDETVSAYLASESPARLIAHTSRDIHPPLYYLLLHFWTRLVGDSEFALAFVSVFWGMLLIAITYEIARRLIDPATGLLAAFLVAISPFNVWYSQEVRMYTLGSFLGMITLGALVRLWGERARGWKRAWLVWVVAAAAGLYTLYYFAFLLIAENLFVLAYWLWRRRRAPEMDARWWRWAGAQAAALVLYLPWLPIFYRQATNPPVPPWRSFTGAWAVLRDSWSALVLGQSVDPARAWLPLLIAAAIYLLALWPGREEPRRRLLSNAARGLLASYTFIPIIAIYLLSFITPLFHVRYVFLYAGPFYIVLAWGLRRFGEILGPRERALRAIAVGTLLIGYVAAAGFSLHRFWTDPAYAADDLRGGVQYIAQRMGPDDVVLINAGYVYTAFRYYYRGPVAWQGRLTDYPEEGVPHGQGAVIVLTGTVDGDPNLGWGDPEADFFAMPWPDAEAALRRLFRHHPRVWVLRIYDTVTDPQGRIRAWLEEHGLLFDERLLTGEANARVQGWRTHRAPRLEGPEPSYPVGAFFGDDVLLFQGYDAPEMRTAAGEALWVTLYWQWWAKPGSDEARVDYSVSLGLFDAQGRRWAQADQLLGGPLYPTSRWARGEIIQEPVRLVMPLGVPPGDYFLDVTVYDASSMATLAVSDPIWGVGGNRVRLGPVTVARPNAWPETAWPEFAHRAAAGFDDGIQLVRYDPPPAEARPGNRLGVRLLWRANRSPGQDDQIVLALLDKAGRPVVTNAQPPAGGLYPMSQWAPGEVVLDRPELVIPGRVVPGRYRLGVGVQGPDGSLLRWREGLFRRGEFYILGEVTLTARPVNFEVPPMEHQVNARLGDAIRLLGFDLSTTRVRPGETLELTLYWQAIGETSESFKVFNHLVGPDGKLYGQKDGYPADGAQPTSGWMAGEVITDRYIIEVAPDAPPGSYRLLTGMYRESDLTRLPTFDADGRPLGDTIPLATITVTPDQEGTK